MKRRDGTDEHTIHEGDCRRLAPLFNEHGHTRWPRTLAQNWCGEHEAAPTEPGGA